jgi:hypothetical protein
MNGEGMTIFEQLHSRQSFRFPQELVLLESRLDELVKDGLIRELPPDGRDVFEAFDRVFVEVESGIAFGLTRPDPPYYGNWEEVDVDNYRLYKIKQPWM